MNSFACLVGAMGRFLGAPTRALAAILRTPAVGAAGRRVNHSRWLQVLAHLGPAGVLVVAALDSSVVPLPVPGATDFLLLLLASRRGNVWELLGCAMTGAMVGGLTTWRIGNKGGQKALRRYVPGRLLKPAMRWAERHPMLCVFLFPLMPPPIPLSPFVLAAGALGVGRTRFLTAFGAARCVRYGAMVWVGATYGRHVVRLWNRELSKWSEPLTWTFAAVMVLAVGYGLWRGWVRSRAESGEAERGDGEGTAVAD